MNSLCADMLLTADITEKLRMRGFAYLPVVHPTKTRVMWRGRGNNGKRVGQGKRCDWSNSKPSEHSYPLLILVYLQAPRNALLRHVSLPLCHRQPSSIVTLSSSSSEHGVLGCCFSLLPIVWDSGGGMCACLKLSSSRPSLSTLVYTRWYIYDPPPLPSQSSRPAFTINHYHYHYLHQKSLLESSYH